MQDAVTIGAFNGAGAVAKKFEVDAGKRFAADRVGHIIQHLLFEGLFNDNRIGHPDNDAGDVAVLHAGRDQVCTGCFEGIGELNRDVPIPVSLIGVQIQLPAGHLLADILGLIFIHDAPADIVKIDALPVQPPVFSADIVFYILEQPLDPDAVGAERHTTAVAKAIFNPGRRAGRLHAAGFKNTPVLGDLIDALLGGSAI